MVGFASRAPGSQRNPVPLIQAPTVGDFLGLVGTHGSRRVLDHVLATASSHAVPVQGLYLPDVPLERIGQLSHHLLRSDHAPFWRAGLPALMWTDTAEFRNPNYHLPTDTPDTLDYAFMAEVAKLLVHVVLSSHLVLSTERCRNNLSCLAPTMGYETPVLWTSRLEGVASDAGDGAQATRLDSVRHCDRS
jgi:hypothetical protein